MCTSAHMKKFSPDFFPKSIVVSFSDSNPRKKTAVKRKQANQVTQAKINVSNHFLNPQKIYLLLHQIFYYYIHLLFNSNAATIKKETPSRVTIIHERSHWSAKLKVMRRMDDEESYTE